MRRSRSARRLGAFVLAGLAAGLLAAPAQGSVTIHSFEAIPSTTAAGAHPDFLVSFALSTHQGNPTPCACTDAKDVDVHLPAGLIGSPRSLPQCDVAQFASEHCPVDSQLGVAEVGVAIVPGEFTSAAFIAPVFNLVPPPSQPALLGFKSGALLSPTFEDVSARTDSDYGLNVDAVSIEHFFPLVEFKQLTWGVPAAPIHDYLRFGLSQNPLVTGTINNGLKRLLCDANGNRSTNDPASIYQACEVNDPSEPYRPGAIGEIAPRAQQGTPGPGHPVSSNSSTTPFLQNPTTCGDASLVSTVDVLAYDGEETHAESPWPATTECEKLSFNPSQAISPTTEAADSPSGAEFRLTVPQFESPSVPSPSELRDALVTLPEGFSLAPHVTNGKQTCSDTQARFGTTEEAQCPEDSKIGSLTVETPILPGLLHGAAYLGEPKPGNRFRLILAFDGFGVHVKFAGTATPDPQNGRIQIAFHDLPQAPFADFNMHIFGSERGPLDTPTQCGSYEVKSVFTPWDSALLPETSRQFFNVDEGPDGKPCPIGARPFSPAMQAASVSNTAGSHTAFSLNLTRNDGDQNLSALDVTTPPGFTGTLRGLTYCPPAAITAAALQSHSGIFEQATPSCPASSYLGETVAGAGPGTHPLYLPGKVYLAGPYKGAPLSFLFITPAVSGGYDLGDVVIRAAVRVNPETAQVTVVSDPLPRIFEGIPLRLRQVLINLNRPGFTLNPTDCEPFAVAAQALGDEGALANLTQNFQVANCASLPFAPKLSLKLTGGVRRQGHPAIHAVLTTAPGEANPRSIALTLPPSELLDNAHIDTICTKVHFAEQSCPAGSLLGHASVASPLLDRPLSGSAYLRSSSNGLPDLALDLGGQFHVVAVARIDAVNGGLRTTFQTVPDVPLGTVTLDLQGGAKGLIQNSESLCGARQKAALSMRGQNGKSVSRKVPLQAACGKKVGKRHRHGRRHRAIRANRGGGR
jgi:hypothetical protein